MKKKKKIKKQDKPEPLNTEYYFSSPIYWTDKPQWVKPLNMASDAYIKQARLNNLEEIKKMEVYENNQVIFGGKFLHYYCQGIEIDIFVHVPDILAGNPINVSGTNSPGKQP